jgi:tetratricopeptide (TPR) repeat protein
MSPHKCPICGRWRMGEGACPHCGFRLPPDWPREPTMEDSWDHRMGLVERILWRARSLGWAFLGIFPRIARSDVSTAHEKPHKAPASSETRTDARELAQQAKGFCEAQDWDRANACATQAIEADPNYVEAYMIRAVATRVMGNLDAAISDYTEVIDLDPNHSEALMFRGACKAQKASGVEDCAQARKQVSEAHPDYRRAAELMPDNEQAGMAYPTPGQQGHLCMAGGYRPHPHGQTRAEVDSLSGVPRARPDQALSHGVERCRDQPSLPLSTANAMV